LRIFGYCKTEQRKKKTSPITKQTQLKQKIVFTSRATIVMSNRHSLKIISVNIIGRGKIVGTLHRKGEDIRHTSSKLMLSNKPLKVKVNFRLEQATKVQRWRRGTALISL
jgi:hypothetical protein